MQGSVLSPLIKPRLWFGMAFAMLGLVGVLSLVPSPDIAGSDKFLHFITYFVLSAGFSTLVHDNRGLIAIVLGLISYGILLEYLQGLTGYRVMDIYDMLANSAGVLAGLMIRLSTIPVWFRKFEAGLFR